MVQVSSLTGNPVTPRGEDQKKERYGGSLNLRRIQFGDPYVAFQYKIERQSLLLRSIHQKMNIGH